MTKNKIIEVAKSVKAEDKITLITEREVKMKKGYPYSPVTKRVVTEFTYNSDSYFAQIMEKYGTHQEATRDSFYKHIEGMLFCSVKDEEKLYLNFSSDRKKCKKETKYFRDEKEIDPFTIQDDTTSYLMASEWPVKKSDTLQMTSTGKAGGDIHHTTNKLENVVSLMIN